MPRYRKKTNKKRLSRKQRDAKREKQIPVIQKILDQIELQNKHIYENTDIELSKRKYKILLNLDYTDWIFLQTMKNIMLRIHCKKKNESN